MICHGAVATDMAVHIEEGYINARYHEIENLFRGKFDN